MEQVRMEQSDLSIMRQLITSANICMLITTDVNGKRTNRPMDAVRTDTNGDCWFFISKSSGKHRDIQADDRIQLIFANTVQDTYLEVHGSGSVTCDEEEINDKWSPLVNDWFRGGIHDPEVCLVRVNVNRVFFWNHDTEKIQPLCVKAPAEVEPQRLAA